MIAEVKKHIDNNDIKGIRYVFIDSLDVDPTFDKYRETYDECKNLAGLFEEYKELSELSPNKNSWNREYWKNIKIDLEKNFSKKRFEYMIEVAKVVYAEKVERLNRERKLEKNENVQNTQAFIENNNIKTVNSKQENTISLKEEEDKRLVARMREQEEQYRKQSEQIEKDKRQRQERQENNIYNNHNKESSKNRDCRSKKVKGIVVLTVVVIVLFVIIIKVLIK